MPDEYVQFPVPANRVADVAVFLFGVPEAMPGQRHKPEVQMSEEQRNKLLTRVYVESDRPFRTLLMFLADRPHPADRMSFPDVRAAMGWIDPRSMAGALGAYGHRANSRYGGYWPFHRHEVVGVDRYLSMDEDVAAVLRDIHTKRRLPTQ
jgi:hypothetical protein